MTDATCSTCDKPIKVSRDYAGTACWVHEDGSAECVPPLAPRSYCLQFGCGKKLEEVGVHSLEGEIVDYREECPDHGQNTGDQVPLDPQPTVIELTEALRDIIAICKSEESPILASTKMRKRAEWALVKLKEGE